MGCKSRFLIDLRANASRLSRGKTGFHPSGRSPRACFSGSCSSAAKMPSCGRIEANAPAHLATVPSSRGVSALAYTMVAERDNQKVTKERTSALILLANARVWASEGWQVVITDADGKQLDPAGFENWLTPVESSPLQPENSSAPEAQDASAQGQDV